MPNSLKARLGKLKYKEIISDKDYERLCKALEQEPCEDVIHRDRTVQDFVDKCRECGREKALDKIRAEIERQEKWLWQAGIKPYNVDIAFSAIKSAVTESEGVWSDK